MSAPTPPGPVWPPPVPSAGPTPSPPAAGPEPPSSAAPLRWPPPLAPPDGSVGGWWTTRRGWLAVTLVALAVAVLVTEQALIEVAFLAGRPPGDLALWVGGPLLSAVVGTIVYRAVTGRSLWGGRRWRWSDLAWGAGAGGAVLLLDLGLVAVFERLVNDPGPPVQGWLDTAMLATPLLVGLGVSVATPLGEEVLCRGLLLRGIEARFPTWVAVVASSVIFGLLHLEGFTPAAGLHVVSAGLAGAIFALVLLRTGHLIAAVTAHLVVNGTYTVVGVFVAGSLVWTVGPAGDIPRIDLEVGACASSAWWDGEAIDEASEVPCDTGHDVEVYHREHFEGPYYDVPPGEAWLADLAEEACYGSFETYVGVPWDDSMFDYVVVLPDDDRWRAGDREVICLLVPYDEPELTEHARGSGR